MCKFWGPKLGENGLTCLCALSLSQNSEVIVLNFMLMTLIWNLALLMNFCMFLCDDDDDDDDDEDDQDIPGNPDLPTTLPPYNQPLHPPISSQATLYHLSKQTNRNANFINLHIIVAKKTI